MGFQSKTRLLSLGILWSVLLAFSVILSVAEAETFSGKVSGVQAGNMIAVFRGDKVQTVRLFGIACPTANAATARKAREFSEESVFGRMIEVEVVGEFKKTGQIIALARFEGKLLNEELVRAGLAWVHPELCKQEVCERWKALEAQAQAEKRGLWAGPQQAPPWQPKKAKR